MKFYRVKPEFDNFRAVSNGTGEGRFDILVGNELYTEKERNRLANSDKCFDVVEVKKNQTYWFFGARFEKKGA